MIVVGLAVAACGDPAATCDPTVAPSRERLGCVDEFAAQAARPLDSSLPGATTVKTIVDQADGDRVHFMDTNRYPLHRAFAVEQLGFPPDVPFVNEYFLPQRRLLLGSVTHYEEPDVWAYELAPYDTASAELIAKAYRRLAGAAWFGPALRFHPTSEEQLARAAALPADVPIVTTDELFAGTSYQPLNLGVTIGQVRRVAAADLATEYVSPREVVVLDRVPNDISVVAAVVTEELQTPLSHVNVLSQQRGTPNMALRDAAAVFAPHEGGWVRLTVGAFAWSVEPVTQAEADAWWATHLPPAVTVQSPDYERTGLLDVDDLGLADVPAAGGKAAHFGELRDVAGIVVPDGFVIPVRYYRQFMDDNGFTAELDALLVDPEFLGDGAVRRVRLADLQARLRAAPIPAELAALLDARLAAEFPGTRMRFRSSTNAEDLRGHTGAGLYESASGQPGDAGSPVDAAVRAVWASLWGFRAYEERAWVSIDPHDVAMAVLVHPAYVAEAANGVAITANPFDPAPGGEDAFYVNVQAGEVSVVSPDPGVLPDQLIYYYFHNNQPATYLVHSTEVAPGATVLTRAQLWELGGALAAIRDHFAPLYDPPDGYGRLPMDVEFKLVGAGDAAHIEIKQARPWPGRGE